jgi:flagellar hook-associated protein 3 FlgL
VSPGQTLTTSVSANASGFQQIAQAYTMLSEFTGSTISSEAQAAVVSTASTLVSTGIDALNNVQTGVGVAQAAVTSANTQITSQVNVLQTSVGDLTNVDTYALSSQVTTLQTQLEASYQLTSRLQSLSLVNYLPNA